MGLISLLTNKVSESSRNVLYHPGRCLRKRLNTNQCESCMKVCPSGAISTRGREVIYSEEKCSACMSCVAVCPQDAFNSSIDLTAAFFEATNGSHLFITCLRQNKRNHEDVVVPCVGVFSSQVISFLFFSQYGSILINLSGCSDCCNTTVAASFTQRFHKIHDYFQAHKTTEVQLLLQRDQLQSPVCDRRTYLSNIKELATEAVLENFTNISSGSSESDDQKRRIPNKVNLIKDLIGKTTQESQKKISSLFLPKLTINDDCDCCPLCKGICPTGALRIDRTAGKILKFNASDCNLCGLCVEFCKKNAITFRQSLQL